MKERRSSAQRHQGTVREYDLQGGGREMKWIWKQDRGSLNGKLAVFAQGHRLAQSFRRRTVAKNSRSSSSSSSSKRRRRRKKKQGGITEESSREIIMAWLEDFLRCRWVFSLVESVANFSGFRFTESRRVDRFQRRKLDYPWSWSRSCAIVAPLSGTKKTRRDLSVAKAKKKKQRRPQRGKIATATANRNHCKPFETVHCVCVCVCVHARAFLCPLVEAAPALLGRKATDWPYSPLGLRGPVISHALAGFYWIFIGLHRVFHDFTAFFSVQLDRKPPARWASPHQRCARFYRVVLVFYWVILCCFSSDSRCICRMEPSFPGFYFDGRTSGVPSFATLSWRWFAPGYTEILLRPCLLPGLTGFYWVLLECRPSFPTSIGWNLQTQA